MPIQRTGCMPLSRVTTLSPTVRCSTGHSPRWVVTIVPGVKQGVLRTGAAEAGRNDGSAGVAGARSGISTTVPKWLSAWQQMVPSLNICFWGVLKRKIPAVVLVNLNVTHLQSEGAFPPPQAPVHGQVTSFWPGSSRQHLTHY